MTALSGLAARIEEAIGLDATVRLLRAKGGLEIYIPERVDGSALAELIGAEAADALRDAFGPGKMRLPAGTFRGEGARRARAMAMLKEGRSLAQVAEACDLTLNTVQRYRQRLDRADADRQPELPFDRS